MNVFTAIVEKCPDTGYYVGYVPGISGAHAQAETLEGLNQSLQEVLELIQEEGFKMNYQFVGTQSVCLA